MNTFEITVQRRSGNSWPVVVEFIKFDGNLPVRSDGTLTLSKDDFEKLLGLQGQPQEYGIVLGEALFKNSAVLHTFWAAQAKSEDGLRILLFIEENEDIIFSENEGAQVHYNLKALRWQRLCAPIDDEWRVLALEQRFPFSLYLPSATERRFPPIGRRDLRALVFVACPGGLDSGLASFDVIATVASIRASLGDIPCAVLAASKDVPDAVAPPTLNHLIEYLTTCKEPCTLMHIVCHGKVTDEGETILYWTTPDNQVERVKASRLLDRLKKLNGGKVPYFTFLSTCESASPKAEEALGGLAQQLVRDLGMPAVVAMTEEVSIATAQVLAESFYRSLRVSGEVDLALVEATAKVQENHDILVSALFSRLGSRPLFSDKLDRALTTEEIKFGLSRLPDLLKERSPILQEKFSIQSAKLLSTLDAEGSEAEKEREQAQNWINQICGEVLDLSFRSIALNEEIPPYDNRCPFRGLYPFHSEDREFFFGREGLIEQLQQKLSSHNFLAVLGASGSGKSSVVLAGLIPALQKQQPDLQLAYLTPNSNPLEQLEASLDKVQGHSFIVVVDQFEELFTLCMNEVNRQTFINQLLTLLQSQKIVITMRADFWGECAPYKELKELMETRQKLIAPMYLTELRKAMEQQAIQVGLRFEAGLSSLVLDEVQDEPGAMPLLQHALLESWKRRHGRWLLTSEYEEIGGVKKAIARTADDFFESLQTEAERDQVQNIFVRLTRLDGKAVQGEKRRDTRRRIDIEDFGGDPAVIKSLILRLADSQVRLVVTSVNETTKRQQVEVAHEALIRHWDKLGSWLDENRTTLQLRERLNQEAKEWDELGKHDEFLLLQGGRLDDAARLREQSKFTLNSLERNYIDACISLQEQEKIAIQQQLAKLTLEKESIRSLRQFEAGREIEGLLAALKNGEALRKIVGDSPLSLYPSFTPMFALQQMLYKTSDPYRFREVNHLEHLNIVRSISFSPDGTLIATGSAESIGRLWSDSGQLLRELRGHQKPIRCISFSRHEKLIATASEDGTAKLWNYSGEFLRDLIGHEKSAAVTSVSFSPHEKLIATASEDGTAKLWNYSGEFLRDLIGHGASVRSVSFSPHEKLIATASEDGTAKLWNYSGEFLRNLGEPQAGVNTVKFSKNEALIITASEDGLARVWSYSGKLLQELPGHRGEIVDAVFCPNGELIATASKDGTIRLWNRSWQVLQEFRGHVDAPYCINFSEDGQFLGAGWEINARLWKRSKGHIEELPYSSQGVTRVRISPDPDNQLIASALKNGVVKLLHQGEPIQDFSGHGWVVGINFSKKRDLIAVTSQDGTVKLWKTSGDLIKQFTVHGKPIWGADLSPDGKLIATAADDGRVGLWNHSGELVKNLFEDSSALCSVSFNPTGQEIVALSWFGRVQYWEISGKLIKSFSAHKKRCVDIAFSPDGKLFATASEDGTAKLWNKSGELIQEITGHQGWVNRVIFSTDGDLIATASSEGAIRLWNYSGELIQEFHTYQKWANSINFSSDNKKILISTAEKPANIWNIYSLKELLDLGFDWLKFYLTARSEVLSEIKKIHNE